MNVDDYATLKDGTVRYYEVNNNKPLWEKEIQGYEAGEGEEVIWYYFEECNGRLYVFRENDAKLLDEFELEN